ncbi:hypothetical protein LSH36_829g00016 [Paralvinella palmiformis]|uniref:Hexosyltransferase n=1 Tax=Paralvinella palmiformis TaxID=53620 RepID=A0AAD9MRZ3_9ANNE|nr:hypothetical protein LSH36_829g00016 [Paralvinella palmiformis]
MYMVLVWHLYTSKYTSTTVLEPSDEVYDPLTLVSRSHIQTLIPDEDEAVIFAPDLRHVTNKTVLVFVHSDYSNTERRQLIRHTWGNPGCQGNGKAVVIFAVGVKREPAEVVESSLDLEMSEHNDILLLNIVDVYDSLTVKGLLAMTWIYRKLDRVNYVIKTDDDVFLNIYAWINAVETLDGENVSCAMAGFVWINPEVLRSGKYAVSRDVYRQDLYPSFCCGAGYIMSRGAMAAILEGSSYIPLLARDDAYFTGILAQTMGVSLFAFPTKTLKFTDYFSVRALYSEPLMAVHGLDTRQWYRLWNGLRGKQRRRHHHQVTIRSIYPDEKGLLLWKLSQVIDNKLKNNCPSEITFRKVIWA